MADFAQNGVIGTLHNLRNRSTEDLEAELVEFSKETPMSLLLPCLYSELEGPAMGPIVEQLAQVPYLSEIIIGLDRANEEQFHAARRFFSRLPQKYVVLWNDGTRLRFVDAALQKEGLSPLEPGKGRNVWFCLGYFLASGRSKAVWAWAMIPGILKTRFNTNEILVSLLLVYVAEQIMASMAVGLMRNPEGSGFPGSRNLQQYASAANTDLIPGTGMHWGVVAAFIAVIFAYILLNRHIMGFNIRLAGQAPRAARFSGVDPNRLILFCLGVSGALAGMAGLFEVAGPAGQISIDFNVGYGFTAIIVAFLGRLHPIGILLAGLLMALTYIGGELAQFMLSLPAAAIQAFQGMLLFFLLAGDVLTNFRVRIGRGEVAS